MKFNPRRLKVLVELTSKCNLRCGMCPLPVLRRPYEDMDFALVEKAERESLPPLLMPQVPPRVYH
jgi:MoaA/NifB/PqqE/SkfB family radical SAM enzyme